MRRLWYPEEVRELDSRAMSELGLPGIALMENAGAEAARAIRERYGDRVRVSVLCGPGNNGGDGFVVARHLHVAGLAVGVCSDAAAESTTPDARTMRAAATAFGVGERAPEDADVIVDALFGSGFRGRLEGAAEALVARVNALAAPIVALDVPSGVDGASGRVDGARSRPSSRSPSTAARSAPRSSRGAAAPARSSSCRSGCRSRSPGPERALRMEPADLALAPRRSPTGSKYDAGGVLVVGGSPGMSGAPALAALAAFRAGAGVVWVCVPGERARGRRRARARADGARRARPGARARAGRARPRGRARTGPRPNGRRRPASSSTRSCAASRRRSCSTPTRCSRSPGGSRRSPGAPGRRR